jgi:hypothetical protein
MAKFVKQHATSLSPFSPRQIIFACSQRLVEINAIAFVVTKHRATQLVKKIDRIAILFPFGPFEQSQRKTDSPVLSGGDAQQALFTGNFKHGIQ